jgi:ATP-binding cassette subfamily B protein
MDCGPTCLRIVSSYYGKSFSLQYLRDKSYISREGVSLLGISDASEEVGFRTKGFKLSWEQLKSEVTLPVIVHWNQNHFVVVYKIKKKKSFFFKKDSSSTDNYEVYVSDPAKGLLKYSESEFLKFWLSASGEKQDYGVALLLEPTPEFYSQKEVDDNSTMVGFLNLLNYLRPYKKFIVQLFLGMLTGSIISLIFPFLTQSIVDVGISNSDLAFVTLILVAQVVLTLGQTANGLIRSWLMLHLTTRVSISFITDFLIKLMKLPISFFDVKMIGDIMQRIGDHNRIQSFITGQLVNIIFSVITLVMYSYIMASYHLGILGIFFLSSIVYILWVMLFLKRRRDLDYKQFQASSANQNNIVQLISGMQEIKLNASEKQKRWEWEAIQAKLFKISLKGMSLNQSQQVGATFINQTKNVIISFLSAKAVIEGDMTLGMMMSMQYILGQLNSPIEQFIGFTQSAQDAKISLERLGEIHNKENEETPDQNLIKEIPHTADIKIDNLVFQYQGPHSEKVIDSLSLTIPKGKVTAIVGSSGSGKTTLLKLLLGFYKPVKGSIKLKGLSLGNYSPREWRKSCGVVMQEGFIFSDSIKNNISVIEHNYDSQKMEKSLESANIKEFIDELPLGLNTKIGNDGHGLSSGQKQRILIARSIYKDPSYVFLDEATNSLDANNESKIMQSLDKFFKNRTVVVVAHRLSTVKNADQIVVLDKGKISEKGTHSELIKQKGAYYNLVKNQLELG